MKIGIIGSGIVGRVLATAFLKEGYEVMIGTRDVAKDEVVKWKEENPAGKAGLFSETASFGELLVLAIAGGVAAEAIQQSGTENFTGIIVIDATNHLTRSTGERRIEIFYNAQ